MNSIQDEEEVVCERHESHLPCDSAECVHSVHDLTHHSLQLRYVSDVCHILALRIMRMFSANV